jgi:transposase-like protein
MRKPLTPNKIASALRQAEAGVPVAEIIREIGIHENTFYTWKRRFGSLGTPEISELRQSARSKTNTDYSALLLDQEGVIVRTLSRLSITVSSQQLLPESWLERIPALFPYFLAKMHKLFQIGKRVCAYYIAVHF